MCVYVCVRVCVYVLSSPGGLFFWNTFEGGGLNREGGLI